MLRLRLSIVCSVVSLSAGVALAEAPRGTYIEVDSTVADIRPIATPTSHGTGSHLLYINPCWGGETFSSGFNDSRTNRSSIISGSRSLPQYPYGEASYNQVVACVRDIMSPFNIIVVDESPGSTPHHEAVVCGHPNDIGMQNGVGGVAPFSCGVIENSITYTFPEVYGGYVQGICETIAQEAAHAWGLDHERLCSDPMTYMSPCGAKDYQNEYVSCGEYSNRNCQCGGATQNSFQHIMGVFGSTEPTPPQVAITEPLPNQAVQPGFVVRADIDDNDGLKEARLYVDGTLITTIQTSPFVFNAPGTMSDGDHEIEIRAVDNFDAEGSDKIYVIVGEPCGGDSDCDDGEACVDGRCVQGPDSCPGGLGCGCGNGSECASGICGNDGDSSICTEPCDPAASGCPGGFECRSAGDSGGVCWPGNGDDASGGCSIGLGGKNAPTGALLLLAGVFLGLVRRRRR